MNRSAKNTDTTRDSFFCVERLMEVMTGKQSGPDFSDLYDDLSGIESMHKAIEADKKAGERAMEVVSALRKFKTENQMSLNENLSKVQVYGDISGFKDSIKEVMHVQGLEQLEEEPETEKKIIEIKLDYSKAGPKYGDKVSEIEEALENHEFFIEDGRLEVADEYLKPEMFNVRQERTYTGEGEMIETENAVVVVG